jgi:hypothetical protein
MKIISHILSLRFLVFSFFIFYSFYNSEIFAKDGIVISGQPGPLINNKHFLENGLDRCLKIRNALKRDNKNEKVVWIIFNSNNPRRGGYSKEDLAEYLIKAENENIEIIYVKSGNELVEFLNSRANCTDSSSLISKLHYYGHATPGYLEIGYVNKRFWNKLISKTIPIKKINPNCFSDSAIINIVGGCRTSIKSVLTKKSVADKFLDKTNGLVIASNVRVYYPGGPVSDKTLVKKNNGQILFFKGTKNER